MIFIYIIGSFLFWVWQSSVDSGALGEVEYYLIHNTHPYVLNKLVKKKSLFFWNGDVYVLRETPNRELQNWYGRSHYIKFPLNTMPNYSKFDPSKEQEYIAFAKHSETIEYFQYVWDTFLNENQNN